MSSSSKLMLAFYGDDFTGSTDAMEALALSGLRTVLFLSPPTPQLLRERFPDLDCVGVAGTSRAMSPAEMDAELAPILDALWALKAPLTHYKVCSTFDSAPDVGNIGHVADMARARLEPAGAISIVAGAPPLRRYTLFGHHFAAAGDEIFRLDRHPTMSRHPVTPMHEADLRAHLSAQTNASIDLMSLPELAGDEASVDALRAQKKAKLVLYDLFDDASMRSVGRLLWQEARREPRFAIGSSGVEYALTAHWRASGTIGSQSVDFAPPTRVEQLLVLSGSASPMTAQQIQWAGEHGFECIRAPTNELSTAQSAEKASAALLDRALAALSSGKSVVIYTATGPDDASIAATRAQLMQSGGDAKNTAKVLGAELGRLARELIVRSRLRRVVIAGGDTASYATRELGLYALEMRAPLTPGAPLCRGYSDDARLDGLEIALKGGQMGRADYFGLALGAH